MMFINFYIFVSNFSNFLRTLSCKKNLHWKKS